MKIVEKTLKEVIESWLNNEKEILIFLKTGQGKYIKSLSVFKSEGLIWSASPKCLNQIDEIEAFLWGLTNNQEIIRKINSRDLEREEIRELINDYSSLLETQDKK